MSKQENMENQEPVIITFNNVEYRKSDLTEEQIALATRLNVIGRKIATLQAAYDDYLMTNDYKNIVIQSFERSINPEVVEEKEKE
mgnify:CR=1 FL=1|tara:strand:+ start:2500 stop:2754 length:255 start_codon:yes stop_codon:yes gene_type:complete